LRLAVVSPFVDRRHGTERALAELLERLVRVEQYETHLYSQRVEDLAFNDSSSPQPERSRRIIWHRVPSVPGPHLIQFLAWLLLNAACRAWDRHIRGIRFDLVLSPGINCLDADVVIVHALFHRLRELAAEDHANSAKLGYLRRFHRRVYYAFLAWLERRMYSDPSVALAAVSQRTADLLKDLFHRQDVRIIPNAVDTSQFSQSLRAARRMEERRARQFRPNDIVLLLIGNDWRVKGLHTVLRAVSSLRELPLLVIAAGNDSPESFRELAKSLGILDCCRFEPSRPDVLALYAAADLYVSPSREDSFGLPVAEAMACGLPVITSVNAGVSGLIHDAVDGFVLADPDDPQALAQILHRLCADAHLRNSLGDAAAEATQTWTWDRNASQVIQLLKDVSNLKLQQAAPSRTRASGA